MAGIHQAAAFAKLGQWYADYKADVPRARKCFQRGLGLNPLQAEAGQLCSLLTPPAGALPCTSSPPPGILPLPVVSFTKGSSSPALVVASLGVTVKRRLCCYQLLTQLSLRARVFLQRQ